MPQEKMSKQGIKRALGFLLAAALILVWAGAEGSAWFCKPYGSVNYRGEPAPDGLKVVAFINGTEFASCETEDGEYRLAIPRDDPQTVSKEGWADDDMINVQVGGYDVLPTFKAFAGEERINLYTPTMDVKLTTWGKIKSLFR